MKKLISTIVAMCMASSLIPCAMAEEITSSFSVYENFDYTAGKKLNSIQAAAEEDSSKGFLDGWKGNVALDSVVSDKYVVAQNGLVDAAPSGSTTIARKMSNYVDLSVDGIYVISWNMKINESALVNLNTNTQKLLFANEGVTDNKSQLQFGFACGRTLGVSPYMRLTSNLLYDDTVKIETGKLYQLLVMIDSSKASNDKISYMIYPSGADMSEDWNLVSENNLDNSFNVLGYTQYTGGSDNNSFGNVSVDGYDENAKKGISNIYSLLQDAENELSYDLLDEADSQVESIDGMLKSVLSMEIEKTRIKIENAIEKINSIYDEIAEISEEEITAENADDIKSEIDDIESKINDIENETHRQALNDALEELKNSYNHKVAVIAAENAVELAEKTELPEDIDKAVLKVNALDDCLEKTDLQSRIAVLQKKIAEQVAEVKVTEAENSKTVEAWNIASEWVSVLDNGTLKENLEKRLAVVKTFIDNYVPSVKNAEIVNNQGALSINYDIEDLCENLKSESTSWYKSNNEGGPYIKIDSSSENLPLLREYNNHYIKAIVTLVNSADKEGEYEVSPIYIPENIVLAYDDFDYDIGEKLNSSTSALEEDITKGFLSGWKGNVSLDTKPEDNYIVTENNVLESASIKSTGLYRELSEKIDLGEDGLYVMSWDMQVNTNAPVADNTRTQKVLITNKGISTGTSQLQFGFTGGRTSGESPYMRLTSNVYYGDNVNIIPGQMYHIIVTINASEDNDDKVKLMVYPEGENIHSGWDIENEVNSGIGFDVLGYQEYVGGNGKNAFGNIRIEKYSPSQIMQINNIENMLSDAQNNLSTENIDSALNLITEFPNGKQKEILLSQAKSISDIVQAEIDRVNSITNRLTQIGATTITIDNVSETQKKLSDTYAEIESLVNETNKNNLIDKYAETVKTFQSKIISVTRTSEKFSYADNTDVSQITSDQSNGWENGYFADEELQTPASAIAFDSGKLTFNDSNELYREMVYPLVTDEAYGDYVKIRFSLDEGGEMTFKAGGTELLINLHIKLSAGGNTKTSDTVIEYGREYTAIMRFSNKNVKLSVFPTDEYYNAVGDIEAECDKAETKVVGIGGKNTSIYEITKENIGEAYVKDAEAALGNMISKMTSANISAAESAGENLSDSILKNIILTSVDKITAKNNSTVPVLRSCGIKGTGKVGTSVEAYYDVDNSADNLGEVRITWYCGGKVLSTGKTLSISRDYDGQYIYFKLIVTNTAGLESNEYQSTKLKVSSGTTVSSGGGGGGGGSFTSGSSSSSGGGTSLPPQIQFEDEKETDGFTDISGHWAEETIKRMSEKGIVNGISDDKFEPGRQVTRAEFVTMIVRTMGITSQTNPEFNDVKSDDWYYESVCAAYDKELISGWEGNFYPENYITREEMAKIILSAFEISNPEPEETENEVFKDESNMSDWSISYIKKAAAAKLITGVDDGRFLPKNNTTRAEAVTVVERLTDANGLQ